MTASEPVTPPSSDADSAPATTPPAKNGDGKNGKRPFKRFILLGVAALALVVGGVYLYMHRNEETTDDAQIAGRTVTISSKVEGYVKTLNIDDNQEVKAGDVLLEIDPADYVTRRDAAAAALAAAQAAYEGAQNSAAATDVAAPSNLAAAQAQVDAAQANWQKAADDLKRMQSLGNEARSRQQLDAAVAAEKSAKSALDDAQAKLRSAQTAPKTIAEAQANTDKLAAQVKQAQADLDQAQLNLDDTKITAPMDGRITRRAVERGDYVKVGQSLGSLVGDDLWVIANFKETQLTHMRPGQHATIAIDAYPGKTFDGTVDSIQSGTGAFFSAFPPENATGNFVKIVQRVPVKITFDKKPDPALALGPGMSVDPVVDTASGGNGDNDAGKSGDAAKPDDSKAGD